jgi:hypothetical protein
LTNENAASSIEESMTLQPWLMNGIDIADIFTRYRQAVIEMSTNNLLYTYNFSKA